MLQKGWRAASFALAPSSNAPAGAAHLEHIRQALLPGEYALAVRAGPAHVPAAISLLRQSGAAPAIFVLHTDSPAALTAECIRAEPLMEELRDSAAELAKSHQTVRGKPKRAPLTHLKGFEHDLESVSDDLAETLEMEQPLGSSGEWLYDNFNLIRSHIAEVRRHFPRASHKILPVLAGDDSDFRIYHLAQVLVQTSDSLLSPAQITAFLDGYQSTTPLTIAELWTFPLMIRLALIGELARLGTKVSCGQRQQEIAYFWADRLVRANQRGPASLDEMIALLRTESASTEPAFLARLHEQVHEDDTVTAALRNQFETPVRPLTEMIRQDHVEQARDRISIANAIGSLRALGDLEYPALFETASAVHAVLNRDPAGIYPRSDFRTRDRMRQAVEEIARNSGFTEIEIAQMALDMASGGESPLELNAAHYLIGEGRRALEARASFRVPVAERIRRIPLAYPAVIYLGGIVSLSLLFVALPTAASYAAGVRSVPFLALLALLALFPASEIAIQIVNALIVTLLPPRVLPKMSFESGIPADSSTLVVVPMMLLTPAAIKNEVDKLEVRYLANPDANLRFALLSDYTDAPRESMPEDDALLAVAVDAIAELAGRYPAGRFLLFHRDRRWCKTEEKWIGWERKRGKLEELNRYLCGEGTDYPGFLRVGGEPRDIRFVITLDADTQLPAGAARRMIETIAHPLNQVELTEAGTHRRGYTIIQPRVSITLPGTTATPFTRLFTETAGTDPYSQAVSDAYQDLFGQGIYHGKAIYDLHSFHRSLSGRFPDGLLLSHDLIEGAHAGVGLASDIELFENFPYDYQSHSRRQHRWIRGDWQILQWIFGTVPTRTRQRIPNPLHPIERWKILDNLRRSLAAPICVALLAIVWLSNTSPAVWSVFVGLCLISPSLANLLNRLSLWQEGVYRPSQGIGTELTRFVTTISFLPHQAWVSADAIVRSLHRMYVSKKHLLEWETAESTHSSRTKHFTQVLFQTSVISAFSFLLLLILSGTGVFWPPFPFLILWIVSPRALQWLRRAEERPNVEPLPEAAKRYLHSAARDTWRYFDDLVGEETNWLPPDNFQEALRVEVAERTSPTNIGMYLASLLAARDLGYISADQLTSRCASSVATLERLERFDGHFLNWYNTRTLAPLNPRYVSTVDSGNLVASLWAIVAGLDDVRRQPVLGVAAMQGLLDTALAARRAESSESLAAIPLATLLRSFRGRGESVAIAGRVRLAEAPIQQLTSSLKWGVIENNEREYWFRKLEEQSNAWTHIVDRYLRWLEVLAAPPPEFVVPLGTDAAEARNSLLQLSPSLNDLAGDIGSALAPIFFLRQAEPALSKAHQAWLEEVHNEYERAKTAATEQLAEIDRLANTLTRIADEHRFGFLYDADRNLFYIGTAVMEAPVHSSHYDLIASEARLSSLVAIAKGDVPLDHWFRLGRPYASYSSGQLLYSWSGTMFEYLMPNLFTYSYENSLLAHACEVAVHRQIEYGDQNDVPWGISESAYSAIDARQTYQYRAFGVPGLGLKRGLGEDLVISPYSTMLALPVDPAACYENLKRLEALGLRGKLGFYEAIDYSRQRSREGGAGVIVYAFMAHHQGMSLLAMVNALEDDVMVRRFHSDPRIKAVESLLYEGVPKRHSLPEAVADEDALPVRDRTLGAEPPERTLNQETVIPRVHLLGNKRYSVALTAAGGGFSRWNDFDLTRWRSDATRDHWGSFAYLRDARSGKVWSAAFQPVGETDGQFSAALGSDHVEWTRQAAGIVCRTEIAVNPEEDVEIRRFTVSNQTLRTRQIELTTFCEICIAPHEGDRAHPAFQKLFVQTEADLRLNALFAGRRLRSPSEPPVWFAESMLGGESDWEFETDRLTFLDRNGSLQCPAGLLRPLSGAVGTVLDPIFSMRRRLAIDARSHVQITLVRAAGESREEVERLVSKYRSPEACQRVFELAWTHMELEFRHLGIGAESAHRFQELAGHMLFSTPRMRGPTDRLLKNRLSQERLWAHGISGDLPIAAVAINGPQGMALVREALLAHTFWALRGLKADLVILNQEPHAYERPLHDQLTRLIEAHSLHTGVEQPGGVFLRNWHQIPDDELDLLLASARIYLNPPRTLAQHLSRSGTVRPEQRLLEPVMDAIKRPSPPLPFLELPYFNGLGGFSRDGSQYSIYLGPGQQTPAPWVNVLANKDFGALVGESGGGFAWFGNSQANRLLPWSNDPVADPAGEALYIRDEETGEFWTPTAAPIREPEAYRANHGAGYTTFEHNSHGIEQFLTVFVPPAATLRIQKLRLRNASGQSRTLTVTAYAEWVLGGDREQTQHFIATSWNTRHACLLARNANSPGYGTCTAFASLYPRATSFSGDRTAFLGRNGSLKKPAALKFQSLSGNAGVALDPCAALQTQLDLAPGEEQEVIFVLGMAPSEEESLRLAADHTNPESAETAFRATCDSWDRLLGTLQVRTPILSVNFLLNRWLLYQTLSCRIWGRSALYQSGGAFGFRDQLQDVLAVIPAAPDIARAHILLAASRQFSEGDVQHWWHPPAGGGVRTRCSDDMLWLPYAVAHYVERTGDSGILNEPVPFLDGPELKDGEGDAYFIPAADRGEEATLFEHCRRALERASARGRHGLPLIGSGDWNDGMNLIGDEGRGESVWLGWFLIETLRMFAALAANHGRADLSSGYLSEADQLSAAIENSAWDGEWFIRAFHDEGTPVGSKTQAEAKIDSIAQSWAAISGAGDPARVERAMASVEERLVRGNTRMVLLFDPPFEHSTPHPGYIQGYPPGVRENGGQYTHAALWFAQAYARLGDGERAIRTLQLLNPVEKTRTPAQVAVYQGEPYVISADVYNLEGKRGKCGWTWYTGSSGWMYRIWIEEVLGFQLQGNSLRLRPVLPPDWPECGLTYRFGNTVYEISITNEILAGNPSSTLTFDGTTWPDAAIRLTDDGGTHSVHLRITRPTPTRDAELAKAHAMASHSS